MPMVEIITRIALTATPSAPFLSPRPTQRPAAMAAASVTRTSSSARLRSGGRRAPSVRALEVPEWPVCCEAAVMAGMRSGLHGRLP